MHADSLILGDRARPSFPKAKTNVREWKGRDREKVQNSKRHHIHPFKPTADSPKTPRPEFLSLQAANQTVSCRLEQASSCIVIPSFNKADRPSRVI